MIVQAHNKNYQARVEWQSAYRKHSEERIAARATFLVFSVDEAGNLNAFEVLREENYEENRSENIIKRQCS